MSTNRSKTKLTASLFKTAQSRVARVNLDDYTPGEISYLGHKYCCFTATALPCRPEHTDRIKQQEAAGGYALMVAAIYRAVNTVKAEILMNDIDATPVLRGRDMVVVSTEPRGKNGSSHAVLFESRDAIKAPALVDSVKDAGEAADVFSSEGVWSRCVRIDESDQNMMANKISRKSSLAFANSLLKYEKTGTVSSNCMSRSKVLETWDLTASSQDLAALFSDKNYEVPENFVFDAGMEDEAMQTIVMDTLSVNMGSSLKKQVFGKPTADGHAVVRKTAVPMPRPKRYSKPVERLNAASSSIGESRVGNLCLAQMDGLPVTKELRSKMLMLRDIEILPTIDVVVFATGNAAECELLWRREGYRPNILFMYPNSKNSSGTELQSYFNGRVRRGGVVAYNPHSMPDFSGVRTLYIDHNVHMPIRSKKHLLADQCSNAIAGLCDRVVIGKKYDYYMVYSHVMTSHEAMWSEKAKNPLFGEMFAGSVKDASMYAYVSARYARMNYMITNYLRENVDPIPIGEIANVYANLIVWHNIHPVTRHIVLTYPYVKTVDGKKVISRYRMFSPVQYYPFGSGRHQELLSFDDDELADFFKTSSAIATTLPFEYVRGRKNKTVAGDDDDEASQDEESDWDDDDGVADEFEGLEEEPESGQTSVVIAGLMAKMNKREKQTLGTMSK